MLRFRWPVLVLVICLPVVVLATGVRVPWFETASRSPQPLPVPDGDREMAFLHTTTNWTTWERFVSGVVRAQLQVPGLRVDDSRAFRDRTTEVPELVLTMAGKPGALRIRWYKQTSEATANQWIQALSKRQPAPLAIIGGGSSDRAAELARCLDAQTTWHGDRPLLFITTGTAEELQEDSDSVSANSLTPTRGLLDVYDNRSFRFCFSNRQMAEAVLDFVWENPDLRPAAFGEVAPLAVLSGLAADPRCASSRWSPPEHPPHVFSAFWHDDPYSTDLHFQFGQAVREKIRSDGGPRNRPNIRSSSWGIPFSVGGFSRPNGDEARVAESILQQFQTLPPQRALLVLPTVANPGRRLLRTLYESAPYLRHRVVAVTGDGISVNSIYRDGSFAWPVNSVPFPLVMFTHQNPVAWDEPERVPPAPVGYALEPPTSTEDVLLFAEMTQVIVAAAFGNRAEDRPEDQGLTRGADDLATRLRNRCPPFFDETGNRVGGGEYVVVVAPKFTPGSNNPSPDPTVRLEVWRRRADRSWEPVRTLEFDQWRTRAPTTLARSTSAISSDMGSPLVARPREGTPR